MNLKYRKKPFVIEAFQMTAERWSDHREWPDWLKQAWSKPRYERGSLSVPVPDDSHNVGPDKLRVMTLEGMLTVSVDDYIIRGVQGELYPCKPDIFEATYEEAV
jgi:hypothetical protein